MPGPIAEVPLNLIGTITQAQDKLSKALVFHKIDLPFKKRLAVNRDQRLGLIREHRSNACAKAAREDKDFHGLLSLLPFNMPGPYDPGPLVDGLAFHQLPDNSRMIKD